MKYIVEIKDLDKLKRALDTAESAFCDTHPVYQGELPSEEDEEISDGLYALWELLNNLKPVKQQKKSYIAEEISLLEFHVDSMMELIKEGSRHKDIHRDYFCCIKEKYAAIKHHLKELKEEEKHNENNLTPVEQS